MENERKCKYCGKILIRRVRGKKKESARDFRRRQFCNKRCSSKFQHSSKGPQSMAVHGAVESIQTGTDKEKKTAFEILEDAANEKDLDWTTRINAAKAMLPYQRKKAGEGGGKKEERKGAAKKAGEGKFSTGQSPKVIGRIG